MSVKGYVLVEAEVGKSKCVGEALAKLVHPDGEVTSVDVVTGQYDAIVNLRAKDLNKLGNVITGVIQTVEGVQRTTTCLAVKL